MGWRAASSGEGASVSEFKSSRIGLGQRRPDVLSWMYRLAAALFVFAAHPAAAVPVAFHFQGEVVSVDTALTGGGSPFAAGAPVSGTVIYDSDALNAFPMPGFGFYPNAVTSLSLTVGGYAAGATDGQITISDDQGGKDEFVVASDRFIFDLTGPTVNGLTLSTVELTLSEMAGDPISGSDLPITPPDVTLFATAAGVLGFESAAGLQRVAFEMTAIPVAEPVMSGLFLAGFLMVAAGMIGRARSRTSAAAPA
jgi:hypothetical protein